MEKNLEGANPVVEGAEIKDAKPTEPTAEPTVRSYTQKELDEAVGKGLSTMQSKLSLQTLETSKLKAEAESTKASFKGLEDELGDMRKQHDDLVEKQFADDPDARKAYIDRRAIADERRQLLKDKVEVERKRFETAEKEVELRLNKKRDVLAKETGIDAKELEGLDEVSMVEKALRFKKEPEVVKETKFDSALGGGGGGDGIPRDRAKFEQWIDSIPQGEYEEKYASKVNELRRRGEIK